jgi:hypothetical protein
MDKNRITTLINNMPAANVAAHETTLIDLIYQRKNLRGLNSLNKLRRTLNN